MVHFQPGENVREGATSTSTRRRPGFLRRTCKEGSSPRVWPQSRSLRQWPRATSCQISYPWTPWSSLQHSMEDGKKKKKKNRSPGHQHNTREIWKGILNILLKTEQNIHTSLLVAYFSQAVTHSSMVSTLISSGMSVCWGQTQSYDMNINKSARNNTALPSSFLTVPQCGQTTCHASYFFPSAVCHCDAWFSQRALTDQMCEDTIATDLILQLVLRSCLLILENTTPCVSHTWACCVA